MIAFNAVRFRVKPGRHQEFLDAHKDIAAVGLASDASTSSRPVTAAIASSRSGTDMDALARARPNMIATLNSFRDALEDLGGGRPSDRAANEILFGYQSDNR